LPSMIQDGSIGRGVRLTARLAVSINARDIPNSKQIQKSLKMQGPAASRGSAPS
jgi:hypothetical protein